MKSFNFPNMFNGSSSYMISDYDATLTNLKLLILSETKSLFGDPAFGCGLTDSIWEQNTSIKYDMVIDKIYTAIGYFMPQVKVKRNDIKIYKSSKNTFAVDIRAINDSSIEPNLYTINLT